VTLAQEARDGRGLDELGPITYQADYPHRRTRYPRRSTRRRVRSLRRTGQEEGSMRELAQETVRTSFNVARHIFRYLSYQMSR
jgi:hypothetical protein